MEGPYEGVEERRVDLGSAAGIQAVAPWGETTTLRPPMRRSVSGTWMTMV